MTAFERDSGYTAPESVIHVDSSHPERAIIVADAQLLFTAQFHRAGPDLVLIGQDGRHLLIPGYFSGEHRQALVAPNGAAIAPDLVDLLAGSPTPGEYAQANQPTGPADPIGRVEKVVGDATVIRNGVSIALNVGDAIYKSDVVQTGLNSSLGIAFPDGTALNLVAHTRMALSDYSYDANSTSNNAFFSLVEGGLSFVAGKVAHTGDMKIGTPVALIGIRGTAGWLYEDQVANVTATAGNVTLHFAAVFDQVTNTESTYTLYAIDANGQLLHDATGNLVALATVSSTQNGLVTTLTGNGVGALPAVATAPPDLTQQQFAQSAVPVVINMAIQAIQQYQQQQNNPQNNQQNNPNPQSNPSSPGSTTPPSNQDNGNNNPGGINTNNPPPLTQNSPIPTNNGVVNVTVIATSTQPPQQITTSAPPTPTEPTTDIWNPPSGSPASGTPWSAPSNWTAGTPPSSTESAEVNSPAPGNPAVPAIINDPETVQNLTVDAGATVAVVSNSDPNIASSLIVVGTADIAGVVRVDSSVSDPSVTFDNGVSVEVGGEIDAHGSAASVFITGSAGVDNSGLIIADDGGTVLFSNVIVMNGSSGMIEAIGPNSLVTLSNTYVAGGTLETGSASSAADGVIEIGAGLGSNVSVFDGSTNALTVDAYVQVDDGVTLELIGTIHNPGTIILGSVSGADLLISGPVTLDGAGTVGLQGSDSVITGTGSSTDALTNIGDLIYGGGTIEELTITNESGGAFDFTAATTLDSVNLTGGDLTIAGGVTAILDDVVLDNVAVTVSSDGPTPSIQIDAGETLTWVGASSFGGPSDIIIDNNGQIIHTGTLSLGFPQITFEGSGTVTENGGNMGTEPQILINVGNTFDGYGLMGNGTAGSMTLTNEAAGTFDADNSSHPYILDPGNTMTNAGAFEATNGATLELESTVANDTTILNNTDGTGTLQAGAESAVLLSNATVSGGTVSIATTAFLIGSGTSAINDAIINNLGTLETDGTFTLNGDTVDGGIITGAGSGDNIINVDTGDELTLNGVTAQGSADGIGATGNAGTITLANTLTLAGTGFTLLLDGAGAVSLNGATIAGSSSGETLENNDNVISGAGYIDGDLTLQNDAAGNVTAQGGTLNILASVTNNGTMTAANGAILSLGGVISGSGSTIVDAGGTVVVGATDTQAIKYDGVGTLQITAMGDLTGPIEGLVQGDIIDFANNTAISSTSISGSTLTVNESSGGPLTYTIGGAISGEYFTVQSDNHGGDELVLSPETSGPTVAITSSGGVTNVASQSLSGTVTENLAPVGTTVELFDSVNGGTATEIGTATVSSSGGGWTTGALTLASGSNSIVAEDTDTAGNLGVSGPVVYTVETSGPTVAITSSGGVTNVASQSLSGTVTENLAPVGTTVELFDSVNGGTATEIGTATVSSSGGGWTTGALTLASGSNSIVAEDTDTAGNLGVSGPVVYTVETSGPTVAITSSGGVTNVASQSLSGTVTENLAPVGTTVELFDSVNGGTATEIGTATVSSSGGGWTTGALTLASGSNSIVAEDTDTAGNLGVSGPVVYTVETSGPTVAITSSGGVTNVASQSLSGTVTENLAPVGTTVELFDSVNGGTATEIGTATVSSSGGGWTTGALTLASGSNSIVAEDTDTAGNLGVSGPVVYTVETSGPTVAITSSGGVTNVASQSLSGTVTENLAPVGTTVELFDSVNGGTATEIGTATVSSSGGGWTTGALTLASGSNSIVAEDTDTAGNLGVSGPVVYTVETSGPTVAITSSGGVTNVASQSLSGTVTENLAPVGTTVELFDSVNGGTATEIGTATVSSSGGGWTTGALTLASGSNSIVAEDTDTAGNLGVSGPVVYTVETSGPTVAITSSGGVTNVASQSLSGTVTENLAPVGTTVELFDSVNGGTATEIGTATVSSSGGGWTTGALTLASGSNSIVAEDTDTAGNLGVSGPVVYTVETSGPTVAITSSGGVTNVASQSLSGTVTENLAPVGTTVELFDSVNGGTATEIGTATVSSSGGGWTTGALTLASGSNSIVAEDTDTAGNLGVSGPVVYTVETSGPTVAITSSGGVTNVASQSLSGTVTENLAPVGTTVELFDSVNGGTATEIGTATVSSSGGGWTTGALTLASGSNSIVAEDTDTAGNLGVSGPVVYTVETSGPTVAITSSGGVTNVASQSLSGTVTENLAPVGTTVELFDSVNGGTATEIGTATVSSSGGGWTTGALTLASGSNSIVAEDTDTAGNLGVSGPVVYTVETSGPTVAITSSGGVTNVASQSLSGTVTENLAPVGTTVELFDSVNGGTATEIGTATVSSSGGGWTTGALTLASGSNSIVAEDTDTAGNLGVSGPVVYTVETSGPTVAITSSGGVTNVASQSLSGTVTENLAPVGTTVELFDSVNGGTATEIGTATVSSSGGGWTTGALTLASGSNSIVAEDTDTAGNLGVSGPVVYTVETSGPTVAITSSGGVTNVASQSLSGTVTENLAPVGTTVELFDSVNGGTATEIGTATVSSSGGGWTTGALTLASGSNSIVAEDTDTAGNLGVSGPVVYTVETSGPTVAITSSGGVTNVASQSLSGTVTENLAPVGTTVELFDSVNGGTATEIGTATVSSSGGGWTTGALTLASGSNSIVAEDTDTAGNLGVSGPVVYTVETSGPTVAITSSGGVTNVASQSLSGTVTENLAPVGTTVELFDSVNGGTATEIGTATVSSSGGGWTTGALTLASGSNSIVAEDTDTAGNLGVSGPVVYTVETSGPTVAITSSGGVTNVASQSLSGTVTENLAPVGTTVELFDSVNGGTATEIGTATVSSSGGGWTTGALTLASGSNSIVAEDTDTAGNLGVSGPVVYTVETSGPTVAITSSGGVTNVASQSLSGTVTENLAPVGTTVELFDSVNGGTATEIGTATVSSSGGGWTTGALTLASGSNSIVAEDTDTAGNLGVSGPVVYTVETSGPTVAITSSGGVTNVASQSLSGTVTENLAPVGTTVELFDSVNGGTATEIGTATVSSSGGGWTTGALTLASGSNSIVAEDTDTAGNLGVSGPVVYTVETSGPTVAITSSGGVTNVASQSLSGTVTENLAPVGTTVELFDSVNGGTATEIGTATVSSSGGGWTTGALTLASGSNSIVAEDTDTAGNLGVSGPVVYTVETSGPTVAITSSGGVTNVASQSLSGTVTENLAPVGTTVELFDSVNGGTATEIGTATVSSSGGGWTTGALTLASGSNSIVAEDTDTAGNLGVSGPVVYTVETGVEYWVDTSSADWSTTSVSDWSFTSPPTINVDTVIDASGTYTVAITSADTAKSLTINDAGATVLDENDGSLTLNGSLTIDAGTFQLADGSSLSGETAITNAGTFEIAEAFTLTDSITNTNGTVQVDSGDTLTLAGGSISGGAINLSQASGATPSVTEISTPGFYAIAPVLSANGEFVAFTSSTTLPGQHNGNGNDGTVELYDVATGHLTNISALVPEADLNAGELFGGIPSISANGQYVVFEGDYPVEGQTYSSSDIFLYNGATQTVTLVQSGAGQPVISGNGQILALQSSAPAGNGDDILVTNQSGAVLDTITGDPNYVPPQNGGDSSASPGSVEDAALSGNGKLVSFWTTASEITVNGTLIQTSNDTGNAEVYVYNRLANTLQMVSAGANGPGNGDSGALAMPSNNADWVSPISANGQFVVFQSTASNLVAGVGDADQDVSNIFLYNLQTGVVTALTDSNGSSVVGSSVEPAISADGTSITFASDASNLPGANGGDQTYLVEVNPATGVIESGPQLLSTGFAGTDNGQNVLATTVSDDGNFAAFGGAALAFDLGQFSIIPAGGQAQLLSAVTGAVAFTGLSLTDYNAAGETLTLTLSVEHGTLAANAAIPGVTVVGGDNGSNGTLEITGSYAAVDAALESGVTYTPTGYSEGSPFSDTLTGTVSDGIGDTAAFSAPFDPQATGIFTDGGTDSGQYDIFLDNLAGTLNVSANSTLDTTLSGGTVDIASGVTLTLDATLDNTVINNSGTLAFTGASTVENVAVSGGDVTVASGVTLTLDGDLVLDNVALTVDSDGTTPSIDIASGATLTWEGASSFGPGTEGGGDIIDNDGHIIHTGTLSLGFATITFEGSGTDTQNGGNTGVASTQINEGNTIDGYGQQGGGTPGFLTIINEAPGVYDADVDSQSFIWDAGASTITNLGLVEATNGGTFEIESTIHNDTTVITNTGGNIDAGAGSEVLLSDATIGTNVAGSGGTITIAAGGFLEGASPGTAGNGRAQIENATIDNSGMLETGGNFFLDNDTVNGGIITGAGGGGNSINTDVATTLTLNGVTIEGSGGGIATTNNAGTIALENALTLSGAFTLEFYNADVGAGTVLLNGATIAATTAGTMLENSGNTISGSGTIGDGNGNLTLINGSGFIQTDGGDLTIDTGNPVSGEGGAFVANGGRLDIVDPLTGTVFNEVQITDGGTFELGASDTAPINFGGSDNAGTLQLDSPGDAIGEFDGLALGDIIDLTNTTVTSATISGSTLTVDTTNGPLTYQVAGNLSGNYFAIQTDDHGGDELVLSPTAINVAVEVVGTGAVQVGQTLVASATITGDSSDLAAPVTYQWQISSDGGDTWQNVSATTSGQFSQSGGTAVPSSFFQLPQADAGDLVRAVASFNTDTGGAVSAMSTPTTPIADVTPVIEQPFSYVADDFSIVKGSSSFSDNFSNGTPPVGGTFGNNLDAFATNGSVWTQAAGQAILSSSGAAGTGVPNTAAVEGLLITNTAPEGTGSGESELGLKEDQTFTVSGTYQLAIPTSGGYGIELTNGTPSQASTDVIHLFVESGTGGGINVVLAQENLSADPPTVLNNQTISLSASQLSGVAEIELNLAHNTTGSEAITGSFELLNSSGTQIGTTETFSSTENAFVGQSYTRAEMIAFAPETVTISGTAEEGQTLTAVAATNDSNATINYQWEESSSPTGTFIDIGTGASYAVQSTDVGEYIQVVASIDDPNSPAGQQTATATSAATAQVTAPAPPTEPFAWSTETSGNWSDPNSWNNNGYYPGQYDNSDQVNIAPGGTIVVTYDSVSPETISSLTTNGNATLDITSGALTIAGSGTSSVAGPVQNAGTFDVQNGTLNLEGTVTNAGRLEATAGGTLEVFDNIDNTGTGENAGIQIGSGAQLMIDGDGFAIVNHHIVVGTVSLTGGGDVTLDGGAITENTDIGLEISSGALLALDNADNTLSGYGAIGTGGFTDQYGGVVNPFVLTNEGTIEASGGTLTLHTGNTIENSGTLEAITGGVLQIEDAVSGNAAEINGGTVEITSNANATGDSVDFTGAGGTLQLDSAENYTGAISSFGAVPGTVVDATDFALNSYVASGSHIGYTLGDWNGSTLALNTIDGAGNNYEAANLNFTGGSYSQDSFALTADSSGGTEVVADPATVSFTGGYDANTGDALLGQALTVNVTDADNGADLGTIGYTWFDNGVLVAGDNADSYTPTAADLSANNPIDVLVSFTSPNTGHTDQVTFLANGVEALAPTNLVINGGFEAGDLTGWNSSGFDGYEFVSNGSGNGADIQPHSGNYEFVSSTSGQDSEIDQTITTTPGDTYQVEFWLANDGATPSDFSASFGGNTLLSLSNSPAQAYTEYTYEVTATGSSAALEFADRNDNSYWYLDDVSVANVTNTPLQITVMGAQPVTPGVPTLISGISLAESGAPSGEIFSVTLADTSGDLSATASGGGDFVSGAGTDSLTITGTLDQVNADLGTVADTETSAGMDIIAVNAIDSLGNTAYQQTIAVSASSAPTNLVVNGSFETGDFTGWALTDNDSNHYETIVTQPSSIDGIQPPDGNYEYQIGSTGQDSELAQTIATTSGDTYQVEFWIANPNGGEYPGETDFSAYFGGSTLLSLSNSSAQGYTEYTFDVTAGTGTSTDLAFFAQNNPDYWYLDDISVTALTGVPVITVPGAQTVAVGVETAITGVSLAETGAPTGDFTVTLTDTYGDLFANQTGTTDTVTGEGTTSLTITGSPSDVNNDLATLADTDNATGLDTIVVNASDGNGVDAMQQTIAVTIPGGGGGPINAWNGSGDWVSDAASNWSAGSPPNAGDAAMIASGQAQINSNLTLDGNAIQNNAEIDVGVASGAIVTLDDGTSISDGTVVIGDGQSGTIDVETDSGATLEGVTVTNNGALDIGDVNSGAILTLDDLAVVSGGTLTIADTGGNVLDVELGSQGYGAALDDVAVNNFGAIEVDLMDLGAVLVLAEGTIVSGGALTVGALGGVQISEGSDGPGATLDNVTVTLDVDGSGDQAEIQVNSGATLTLDNATITTAIIGGGTSSGNTSGGTVLGGTITNIGVIDVADSSTIENGISVSGGTMTIESTLFVEGSGATLDSVTVTDSGAIDVDLNASGAVLTLVDDTTIIGGGAGTLTIGSGGEVDIETGNDGFGNGATFDGVTVTDNGAIDVDLNASGAVLTLIDGTVISGNGVGGLTIGSQGSVAIENDLNDLGATLDDVSVDNSGDIQVDPAVSTVTLHLIDGTTISGGDMTIGGEGVVDVEAGTIDDIVVIDGTSVGNSGLIDVGELSDVTLYLEGTAAIIGGALTINSSSALDVEVDGQGSNGAALDDVAVTNDGAIDVDLSDSGAILTLDAGTTLNGGTLNIDGMGAVNIDGGVNGYAVSFNNVIVEDQSAADGAGGLQINSGATLAVIGATDISGDGLINLAGALEVIGSTLTVASTVGFNNNGGSVVIADGGTADFQDVVDPNVSFVGTGTLELGNSASYDGIISGFGAGDTLELDDLTYNNTSGDDTVTWTQNSSAGTLAISNGTRTVDLILDGDYSTADFDLAKVAGSSTTEVVFNEPDYWGSFTFPLQPTLGVHVQGGDVQVDALAEVVAVLYSSVPDYNPASTGPYSVTRAVLPLDPFMLPKLEGSQVVVPATELTLPAKSKVILPNISSGDSVSAEGIGVYVTQIDGSNFIDQVVATPNSDAPLTIGSPTTIESGTDTVGTIYNLDLSFRSDNSTPTDIPYLSTYAVAWDQYSSGAYAINFQIFNADGSTSSGVETPAAATFTTFNDTSVSATPGANNDATNLPAWEFRSGGGIYALAFAELSGSKDVIQFQGYNLNGTPNTSNSAALESFQIQPNLSAYSGNDPTNAITQDVIPSLSELPGAPSQQLQFGQVSANNDNDWVIGWNETVTNAGTGAFLGDQVEFVVDEPGSSVIYRYTAQLGDAQNVRVADYTVGSDDFVLLAYGDATATHLVEFEITGSGSTTTEIASITDPTTVAFTDVTSLGNGLFAVEYDNVLGPSETSQFEYKLFDFATTGLNDPTLSTAENNYIVGTQFDDAVIGANGVNNLYYFTGLSTTSGIGPADTFNNETGGGGWNIAIFPDARSDYSIRTADVSGTYTTTVASNGDDPLHTGSLAVSNVQILAFEPVNDPTPQNGTINVTGGTYVILGEETAPLTIQAGATAELDITASGATASAESVTFAASNGMLVLDQPSDFSGTISGISGSGDLLDLVGFAPTDTASTAGGFNPGTDTTTLTVLNSSDAVVQTLTLSGDYAGSSWSVTTDASSRGVDIFDPPAVTAAATIAAGANLDLSAPANEVVTFTGGTGALVLNDPDGFTGQIVGFTGTAPDAAHSDTIDLVGINYDSSSFAESYNSTTGLLTVTDGTHTANITFDDFNATLDFASDGDGGTLITDPPATSSDTRADMPPDWDMKLGHDKIDLVSGQATGQTGGSAGATGADGSNDVLVSLHSDNFVFRQDLGAEINSSTNSHTQADELANHPNMQLAQQLTALVTPELHHEVFIDLVHNDVLPSSANPGQWHAMIENGFHLH